MVCFGVHYFFLDCSGWLCFVFWFGFAVVVNVEGFPHVRSYAVQDGCGRHFHVKAGYVCEFDDDVWFGEYGFGEVFADFVLVHFECRDEPDVADVVAAVVHVHQARHCSVFFCVFVVLGSLDECAGAVADAYECYADFWHVGLASLVVWA